MGFMEIETLHDVWYTVETDRETFLIPESVCGRLPIPDGHSEATEDSAPAEDWEMLCGMVRDYTDGGPVQAVSAKESWGARYSAPGYLDCTEWCLGETEQEARDECIDIYGDEEEDD